MFKKSFVAIYFSSGRLSVVLVTANKKKVKKYVEVELPQGLINNYAVTDKQSLSKIIKGLWKKFGIREKSVGIILPEFSTLVKSINIPRLKIPEVDEAVRWQAQEFLPTNLNDTVLDWKIVKRNSDSLEVSVVSVDKEILIGFVESAVMAGLFPLVVETPSISLVRLCAKDEKGILIVYKDLNETLLILVDEGKVIASSVGRDSETELTKTALRMISHYKEIAVKKIYICGSGVSETLIQKLNSLKLEINNLKVSIGGLNESLIQKFLIPISMEMAEPTEPSDPESINLLPSNLVRKYKRENLKVKVWSLTLTITLFVWICFFATLTSYFFISGQISGFNSSDVSGDSGLQKRKTAIQEVKDINAVASKVLQIKSITLSPETALNSVNSAKPSGVVINSYKFDLEKHEFLISGTSDSRSHLIEFKDNLEKNQMITGVTIPISNFEKEVNLDFNVTLYYGGAISKPNYPVNIQNK